MDVPVSNSVANNPFVAGVWKMRVPDFLSAFTLNVVLALLSMIMAIVALALLLFVLAKDSYLKEASSTHRDKLKRHESFVVDFKDPSSLFLTFL
uniref:Col_cuticle_N domain-containing protein n=1 Tax=Angiostrongylus cantonensis TaxID=6313 RepID=A0A0K0DRI0_ANGCA